jgi:hypothetical protein
MERYPMALVGFLDDLGRPAWIGLVLLSFVLFPPAGLVLLGYLLGSGRMCWRHRSEDRWQRGYDRWQQGMERMQQGVERMQQAAERWCGPRRERTTANRPTGNRAFDEYRSETLRRLEDEQREFMDFLDRLRHARDRAEFDQFMAERRQPGPAPEAPAA